jgi:hypothetical protein
LSVLVFLDLLESHFDLLGQIGLGHPEFKPPVANAFAQYGVYRFHHAYRAYWSKRVFTNGATCRP